MTFKATVQFEPFRVKTVDALGSASAERWNEAIQEAGYNPFNLRAEDILIDLLTDSGTSALSAEQWAAMMRGDESYAGSRSFYRFEKSFRDISGFEHIFPTHQGRASEHIFFTALARRSELTDLAIPNNTHFDTTRANIELSGIKAVDLLAAPGLDPALDHPFKGDMDVARLSKLLEEEGDKVPLVMLTVTNNAGGGQPVSMANIRAVSEICQQRGIPLILDACRFAENAMFIKRRERGYADRTPKEIAREMFSLADGCTISAKKDGMVNIGGILAMRDARLAEDCRNQMIASEGFPTYGGLAGYDMEALAVGLQEVLNEDYLNYRLDQAAYLGSKLEQAGIPIVRPTGGHAVFVDAGAMLPHIPPLQFPAWALSVHLYEIAGIRSCEIGSMIFAKKDAHGGELPAPYELLRLALPRRAYSRSHLDYVAEAMAYVMQNRRQVRGMAIVSQSPVLRHFTAKLAWIDERKAA
ncbi:tryptophanase [Rhizobium leguminosarum bv. trifolii WSM597]|uniref:Tryptophanase n=1 Tax=Rhizobium leguminosarum bv. trifolii WSM597 TaxID=754764 RepID=I9NJK2_RHILT|nr:tryptophanase [Rhizobium leguminosarum]EJB06902.1 tryptophanase [Rhizobium leguminosarum bv. trifolii WSM597]